MKKKEWQPTNHSKCCIKKLFMFHLYQFEGWVLKAPPLCHMALLSKCNWQKSLTWATKYCCPPRPSILCTPFHLYIGASRSKVGLHIVLVKAEYSVFIKYACYACANYRKNNMASIFNLPQHSLLVPFLEGFEKIFLGMEYFNSQFGHFQIIALSYFW